MELWTHAAAILVGVLVTLALVGTFRSNDTAKSEASSGARSLGAAASGDQAPKKKNKKKKSKSKKAAEVSEKPTSAAANAAPKSAGTKAATATPAPEPTAAPAPAPAKSKKKKKKNASTKDPVQTPAPAPRPVAAPAPLPPAPKVVEEEWNSVQDPKKKRKKKKPVVVASTMTGTVATSVPVVGMAPIEASNGASPEIEAVQTQTISISVDPKKIGLVIGPKGATVLAIQEKSGCQLDINAPSREEAENNDEATATVTISGTDSMAMQDVKQAVMELATKGYATLLTGVKSTESLTVMVDPKKVGIIIGPKGATMNAIQEKTGCSLDINAPSKDDVGKATKTKFLTAGKPSKPKAVMASVVISGGDSSSRQQAKKAVSELSNKGYATLLEGDDFSESSMMVHPKYLSEIVGAGGKTIRAIQDTLQVKLTIPPTDWKPNSVQVGQVKMAKVGIAGSKESTKKTKEVIQALMQYHHHEVTHPGMIHEEVHVPQEFFHCVIGPRGSEIKHIRGNFKVEIFMPQEDSVTENVIVVGKQSQVDKAISYIQVLMDRDSEQRERKYNDEYF